ncbi:DUF4192 family protein [Streptomyces fagopyri]|uniref:DUF4192 family protein n=1 Tax=Streptomyces fagopyri TaxID=2662397 RepID=A0A5Q0L9U1_9ACTN|nr:DUF4192 domain-containing protein [Streptomyces fagopyri]QFZ73832.1 DUF4192 family protein [Streptomyces fagopyri]
MTNHNEPAGASGDSGISGRGPHGADGVRGGHDDGGARAGHDECGTRGTRGGRWKKRTGHDGRDLPGGHQITLRTPAELADALPYLLGYRPEDSIVLAALHDAERRGRFGGRARLGIPAQADDWPSVADQLAHGLVKGSERRGARPESMVAYLCQEPASGESGRDVMERLRPLAQLLRTACGRLDVPVIEALCISDGRFWSYCCPGQGCCSPEGEAMGLPGTSVLAAAATYAGLQVRGSLRELTARLVPWERRAAVDQEVALDAANRALIPRILDDESRAAVSEETLAQARRLLKRFAEAPSVSGIRPADLRDDGLLETAEAASLILGLQDRTTRDRAAEWMEGDEAGPALRLWRALARRCVGSYGEHAAAPLTLAGWVAWSSGDELEAREALAMALAADPDYLFARLLHQACNEGLDPESIRRCLRAERTGRPGPEAGRQPGADPAAQAETAESSQPSPDSGVPESGVPAPAGGSDATARSSGAGVRRRRRTRSAGNGGTRVSHRSSGARGVPAPRPAEDPSPTGDGPGRASGRTSDRARARREGGRRSVGEET